ncbi:MAG: 50S ribosomal protein L10 [Candidatus Aminicenantes bacterium]|nr:50S ribosomal protein L10 [Candidatus Aminicenantes bacterium]
MPSEKILEQNKKKIDEIGAIFGSSGVYFIDYRGLNVPEIQDLRGKIKRIDSGFKVIKNRLIIKYFEKEKKEFGREHFNGPTAVAYSDDKIVEVAKILSELEKDSKKIKIKFGFIDEKFLSEGDIKSVAKLPGRDQLMSQLAFSIIHPLKKMGMALSSPLQNMLILMQNLKDKKEKEEMNNG